MSHMDPRKDKYDLWIEPCLPQVSEAMHSLGVAGGSLAASAAASAAATLDLGLTLGHSAPVTYTVAVAKTNREARVQARWTVRFLFLCEKKHVVNPSRSLWYVCLLCPRTPPRNLPLHLPLNLPRSGLQALHRLSGAAQGPPRRVAQGRASSRRRGEQQHFFEQQQR